MLNIPVSFTHDGKEYTGHFTQVTGGGNASMYHLMVKGFYKGQMFTTSTGLRYRSQNGDLDYLENYFIAVVEKWLE